MEPPGKIPSQKFCDHITILGKYRPQNWIMKDDVDTMHDSRKALQNNVISIIATATFCFFIPTHQYFSDGVERALCCPCKERRGQTKLGQ